MPAFGFSLIAVPDPDSRDVGKSEDIKKLYGKNLQLAAFQ